MILTLDTSTLTLLVNPDARPPEEPETGQPLRYAKERVENLITELGSDSTLIIPTPVLAEALVIAGRGGPQLLGNIDTLSCIQVVPFDQRCAIELAAMTNEAIESGSKKGLSSQPWQKVKFDRQIIAIAKISCSDKIFSDDLNLCKFAESIGVATVSTWELLPPEKADDLFSDLN